MQLQGETTYCGVCAFNNSVGNESISVNDIADDMWLQQFENMGFVLTDNAMYSHKGILMAFTL